ncbi:MAG: glycine betaine ABC transporter substrate-binding protein [Syntrophomonadaceae bacterium]
MKIRNTKGIIFLALITLMAFAMVGCANNVDQSAEKEVRLLYVQWACASAETHIMAEILENKMGYKVELMDVAAAAMYEGLANGEADAIFTAWLPLTHGDYMDKVGDRVEDLGPSMEGAKIGLVVPKYVTIDSIEDLNAQKDKFKGQIIGIDSGAGIMKASNQALADYGLDYEVVEGSEGTMIMSLKEAIDREEWVVVTGWTPHWKFARWDLKYLDDPKKVYGEAETINTIVRLGLKQDHPDAYELFDNFAWSPEDLGAAMALAEDLGDPKLAAQKWVEQNPELVNSWLPEQYK